MGVMFIFLHKLTFLHKLIILRSFLFNNFLNYFLSSNFLDCLSKSCSAFLISFIALYIVYRWPNSFIQLRICFLYITQKYHNVIGIYSVFNLLSFLLLYYVLNSQIILNLRNRFRIQHCLNSKKSETLKIILKIRGYLPQKLRIWISNRVISSYTEDHFSSLYCKNFGYRFIYFIKTLT